MVLYALRRFVNAIPILIGITIISFFLMHIAPGGPLNYVENDPKISLEEKQKIIKAYGLDQPIYVQFTKWVGGVVQGDFGTSFQTSEPTLKMIKERIPTTLLLTVSSFIISLLIAIPLGIAQALRPNSKFDQTASILTFGGISIPSFWLAILFILFFSVRLHWFPSGGLKSIGAEFSLMDRIKHLAQPITAMVIGEVAVWTRYIRSSMLEVINQDFIRTARAKGLYESRVLFVHALRNALLPLTTIFGTALAGFFGGALIIENIFAIPGLGRLAVEASFQRDYPVIIAVTMMIAILYVVGSIISDLLITLVDPRIRLKQSKVKV